MGSELDILVEFTKELRKDLARIESKIDKMNENIYDIG